MTRNMPIIRRTGAVILGLVVSTAIVAAGLGWYLLAAQLPDPRIANRAGLCRWLVLRDLSAEPRDVQRAIVDRLQTELKSGLAADSGSGLLTPANRRQLQGNAEFLQQVWFEYRVEQYASCRRDEQMPFLEEQIDTIANWSAIQLPDADSDTAGVSSAGDSAVQFFGKIEGWIERATGDNQSQMITAVQDGVVCWLATRDLADQPSLVRLELALRIVRELNAGMRLDEILLDLTPPQREKLFANGELLLEAWLHDQAQGFAKLPESERTAYLDARLDEVFKWGVFEVLAPAKDGADDSAPTITTTRAAGLVQFSKLVDEWIERSDPSDRPDLVRLVASLQRQLLWRQLWKK